MVSFGTKNSHQVLSGRPKRWPKWWSLSDWSEIKSFNIRSDVKITLSVRNKSILVSMARMKRVLVIEESIND